VGTDRRSVTPRPSVEGVDQRSGSGGRLINEMRRVGLAHDYYLHFVGDTHSGVRGGGKCPDEEHST
jgi:hypothetical protein